MSLFHEAADIGYGDRARKGAAACRGGESLLSCHSAASLVSLKYAW